MYRNVPKYFINIMLSWFQCCVSSLLDRVMHYLLSLQYMLVCDKVACFHLCYSPFTWMCLLIDFDRCGCKLLHQYFGCILYADGVVLLSHAINAMRTMFKKYVSNLHHSLTLNVTL